MRRLLPLAGPFFVLAGVLHFLRPRMYEAIMPDWLPAHRDLVYASGVCEAVGGLALMAPDPGVRRAGGYFQTATMLGVFPANVHMARHPQRYRRIPRWSLYARLPLQ